MKTQTISSRLRFILLTAVLLAGMAGADCPTADLTGDCQVDLADLSHLASHWLDDSNPQTGNQNLTGFNQMSVQWLDEGNPDPAGIELITIPSGSFQMGDSIGDGYSDEKPVHTVTLASFQMSKHEITNAQYAQFLNAARAQNKLKEAGGVVYAITDSSNAQPWCDTSTSSTYSQIVSSSGAYSVKTRDGKAQTTHPVVCVSWYGAKAFCDFYGYQLPTEAQWEYAARGGLSGQRFPWVDTNITHSLANYWSSTGYGYDTSFTRDYHPTYATGTYPYTSPVGSFPANGYGLCDMAGNVWEWCSDWYGSSYYSTSPVSNPTGPASGSHRVFRSGCWGVSAYYCRVARRRGIYPDDRYNFVGFRVCRP